MDEGPFRASRPADRRAVSRQPEPTYRQPEEPQQPQQPRQEPPRASTPSATQHPKKAEKSQRRLKLPLIALVVVLVLVGLFAFMNSKKAGDTGIDKSKYQAVFLVSGQVYFGKLQTVNDKYLKLTDIYYLQTKSATGTEANPQETSTDQSDVQLIKLGEEIHGPEDEMTISRDQVSFFENITEKGKVGQSIESYKKSHQ